MMLPPEGLATVPTSAGCTGEVVAGFPPDGAKSGGHIEAHPPTHLTFPPFSGRNTYTVSPLPLTRAAPIPPGTRWVAILVTPCAALVVDEPVGVAAGVERLDDELPQDAASRARGTTSGTGVLIARIVTSRIRLRRLVGCGPSTVRASRNARSRERPVSRANPPRRAETTLDQVRAVGRNPGSGTRCPPQQRGARAWPYARTDGDIPRYL
jgi:hypothetical protein